MRVGPELFPCVVADSRARAAAKLYPVAPSALGRWLRRIAKKWTAHACQRERSRVSPPVKKCPSQHSTWARAVKENQR
jgi:hypothetical protein